MTDQPGPQQPSGLPTGYEFDLSDWAEPIPAQQGEFLGRILDPVRAAALHEAVRAYPYSQIDDDEGEQSPTAEILAIARTFEAYLDPGTE